MHPTHGGRVLLELVAHDADGADYRVTVFTTDEAHHATARVAQNDGKVSLAGWSTAPPEWLAKAVPPLLRTLWTGRRADPQGRWPRRVLRWRGGA